MVVKARDGVPNLPRLGAQVRPSSAWLYLLCDPHRRAGSVECEGAGTGLTSPLSVSGAGFGAWPDLGSSPNSAFVPVASRVWGRGLRRLLCDPVGSVPATSSSPLFAVSLS